MTNNRIKQAMRLMACLLTVVCVLGLGAGMLSTAYAEEPVAGSSGESASEEAPKKDDAPILRMSATDEKATAFKQKLDSELDDAIANAESTPNS